jgi:hypothetical protein
MTEPMTPEAYAESLGTRCPVCGSDMLEGWDFTTDDGIASQEVNCTECNASWRDVFTLTGYDNLEVG